jgi:hypothetical protein
MPSARINGTVIGPVVTPPESKAIDKKALNKVLKDPSSRKKLESILAKVK